MLTPEEDMEIASLKKRGWSISAISRHTGHDRKTVRGYLSGEREPGVRARVEPDVFDRFEPYVRQRLTDDPHVRATVLFGEVVALGYVRSYPRFTAALRDRGLRPHCEPCASSNGRAHVDIEHPSGEEIQWDWLELDDTPWRAKAYVLVGALSHSGRVRGWFSEADDQAHLVVGIHEILARLGGTRCAGCATSWSVRSSPRRSPQSTSAPRRAGRRRDRDRTSEVPGPLPDACPSWRAPQALRRSARRGWR
jgi:hypothetical protein